MIGSEVRLAPVLGSRVAGGIDEGVKSGNLPAGVRRVDLSAADASISLLPDLSAGDQTPRIFSIASRSAARNRSRYFEGWSTFAKASPCLIISSLNRAP